MQKETRNKEYERSSHEGQRRSEEKSGYRYLSQVRDQNVPDFRKGIENQERIERVLRALK